MRDEKIGYKILYLVLDKSYKYKPFSQYLVPVAIIRACFRMPSFVPTYTEILTFMAENGSRLRNILNPDNASVGLGTLAPLNAGGERQSESHT